MISSSLELNAGAAPRILLFGAHCDDIEIGCGGALAVLTQRYPAAELRWCVLSSPNGRASETRRAATMLLPADTRVHFDIRDFRESYFPHIGAQIKEYFESVKQEFSPDVVFTHFTADKHQDHRVVAELTHNAYRNHLVLEYEIVKYDGDLGSPNIFVPISRDQADHKVRVLLECFSSQSSKHWFTADTFLSLMRLRGVESNSPSGYAEAFHCRKLRFLA